MKIDKLLSDIDGIMSEKEKPQVKKEVLAIEKQIFAALDKVIKDFKKNTSNVPLFEEFAIINFEKPWREIENIIRNDKFLPEKFNLYKDAIKTMLAKEDKAFKKEVIQGYGLDITNTEIPNIDFIFGDNESAKAMTKAMILSANNERERLRQESERIGVKANEWTPEGSDVLDEVMDED